jgi:uncharacterized membrane protein
MAITLTTVPTYTVTALPFPPVAINDAGQIAGSSSILYNGVITDLNLLVGGDMNIMAMNEHGDILASGQIGVFQGYYYIEKNKVTTIYKFKPAEGQFLQAFGMNDQGEVVGNVFHNIIGGHWNAFLWKDGVTTTLDILGDQSSVAYTINNHEVIVGVDDRYGSVRWVGGLIEPLGIDPYYDGRALTVNDAGTIAIEGGGETNIWKDGGYSPLIVPIPSTSVYFRALNEKDEVLVSPRYLNDQEQWYLEPAIHNQHGTYYLNCVANLEPGWRISDATDLNGLGQIVGTKENMGGTEQVGILLTPYEKPTGQGSKIFLPLVVR